MALSASRNTPEWNGAPRYHYGRIGVEASTSIYIGGMVAIDAAGYAVPAQVTSATKRKLKVLGICEYVHAGGIVPPGVDALNQTGNSGLYPGATGTIGAANAISIGVVAGIFGMDYDSSITALNVGELCFALDDRTVGLGTLVANTTSIVLPAVETVGILGGTAFVLGTPHIIPGTFDAYSATGAGGTHWLEGTDFILDYETGVFYSLTGGGIAAGATVYVTYRHAALHPVAGRIIGFEGGLAYVNFLENVRGWGA